MRIPIPKGPLTLLVGIVIVVSIVFLVAFADFLSPYGSNEFTNEILTPPNVAHPMGTDALGRDILSRIIYGARVSVGIGLAAVAISGTIGVVVGAISAYYGGKLDRAISIPMDSIYSFPSIITALLIAYSLGGGGPNTALAIAIAWIPSYFRVVRSIIFSVKELTFIEAEKAIGAGTIYIITRHILPACLPSIASLLTLGMRDAILAAAGLGFLGIGIPPPTPELGADLSEGRRALLSGAWWPSVFPGLMIFIIVLGFNMLGEGLNELVKLRRTTR